MKLHHPIYIMSVGIAIVCTGAHLYLQQLEVKHVHHCYVYFIAHLVSFSKSVNLAVYPSCHLECKVNAQWQLCKHQASNVPWIRAIVTSQIGQVPFFGIYISIKSSTMCYACFHCGTKPSQILQVLSILYRLHLLYLKFQLPKCNRNHLKPEFSCTTPTPSVTHFKQINICYAYTDGQYFSTQPFQSARYSPVDVFKFAYRVYIEL